MANSFAQDTFQRADGTLSAPWTVHPTASGAVTIMSNKIRASTTTTVLQYHSSAAAFLNGTVSTKTTFASGSGYTAGAVGRLNATAATFYSARMNNSGAIELIKSVSGTITVLGSFTVNLAVGATTRVGLRMNGSSIEALRDNVSVIAVTDTSIAVAGLAGVRMTGGSSATAGLYLSAFSATDSLLSPPIMPTDVMTNFSPIQREDFSIDVERGSFGAMTTGSDRGLLDPNTYGGSVYSNSFKVKATGPIPNETNDDYDVNLTTWVQDDVAVVEMFWHTDGRAKGGAIKPIPYPDKVAQTYGRWRYAYRFSDTGTNAVGFGTVFDFISNLPDSAADSWKNGSGEYGFPENGHGTTGPLGAWIRPSDSVYDPNRSGNARRRNFGDTASAPADARAQPGVTAPSGMNDWHVSDVIFEPGRTRLITDNVTIWDDTSTPVHSPLGFLMQNGKPGNPASGAKAQIEIAWIAIDSYTAPTPPANPITLAQRLHELTTALGLDYKAISVGKKDVPNLVASIQYPITIAHRGGMNVWPEETVEAYEATARGGFGLECDVYKNASNSLICVHDNTGSRVTQGISGDVRDSTDAQWRRARMKSTTVIGAPTGQPMFFVDLLNRYGGEHLIVPEIKTYDTAAVTLFINAIKARDLENSVIAQCFDYATCVAIAAAGIQVTYLTGATISPTPATLLAAGIKFWSPSSDVSAALITQYHNAGVRVIPYTINTAVEQDALIAKGVDGVFSNDPFTTSRQVSYRGNMPIDDMTVGGLWPGARFLQSTGTSGGITPSPELPVMAYGGVGLHALGASPTLRFLECPWAEPVGAAFSVHIRGTFANETTGLTQSIGGVLWGNSSNADQCWEDGAVTGQYGYTWVLRRNGQMQVWKYVSGAAAVSVYASTAATDASGYSGPANNLGEFDLLLTHDGSNVTIASFDSNRDLPQAVTTADSNTFTNMKFGLRYLSPGFVTMASVTPR